jgi:hypothetical protein
MSRSLYEYADDRTLTTVAVHYLTEFADHVSDLHSNDFETQTFIVFTEALTDLICDGLKTAKMSVSYAKVIDRLNSRFIHTAGRLVYLDGTLIDEVRDNFIERVYHSDIPIKNPRAYMRTCIWNAMTDGRIALKDVGR